MYVNHFEIFMIHVANEMSVNSFRSNEIGWVTKNLLSRAPPCFGRHVKPLVPVAFAIVSTHSSFKEG
jgi:hypothetical protein